VDRGVFSAGQRACGAWICHGAGSAGKGLRVAGVTTIEQANHYLQTEFVPWWNQTLAVAAANPDDAHRPLEKHPDLAAILSHVEARPVHNDYTIQFEAKVYQIARKDIGAGLRGALVRVEKRRDGSVAVRFHERYLAVSVCEPRPKLKPPKAAPPAPVRQTSQAQRVGPELRSEEGPPDLAGGTKFRRQTGGVSLMLLRNRLRKWREAKSRPIQGNSPRSDGVTKTLKSWGRSAASRCSAPGPS
jgi:hypothetical protein